MRTVTAMGAEVILHPVMTHTIDRDVDINVAKASAAIFQAYVFDINGAGGGGMGQSCVIDPAGHVLHQAGGNEEMMPVEIEFDQVRRQRVRGMRTMGQPLKKLPGQHHEVLGVYDVGADREYLDTLGPLAKPQRAAAPSPRPRCWPRP